MPSSGTRFIPNSVAGQPGSSPSQHLHRFPATSPCHLFVPALHRLEITRPSRAIPRTPVPCRAAAPCRETHAVVDPLTRCPARKRLRAAKPTLGCSARGPLTGLPQAGSASAVRGLSGLRAARSRSHRLSRPVRGQLLPSTALRRTKARPLNYLRITDAGARQHLHTLRTLATLASVAAMTEQSGCQRHRRAVGNPAGPAGHRSPVQDHCARPYGHRLAGHSGRVRPLCLVRAPGDHAVRGGSLYRSAIVAQPAEVPRAASRTASRPP